MASLDFLRESMEQARCVMDDASKDAETRRCARSRFWHCMMRVGTLERSGMHYDEPGHFLANYSEVEALTRSHRKSIADKTVRPKTNEQYAKRILDEYDKQERANELEKREIAAEVNRKARESL